MSFVIDVFPHVVSTSATNEMSRKFFVLIREKDCQHRKKKVFIEHEGQKDKHGRFVVLASSLDATS